MNREFLYYSNLSQKIFEYLNGRINKLNTNIYFQINDSIPGYGELYMRTILNLNLKRILIILKNKEQIETNILFVICHELYHADQEVDDENYLDSENNYSQRKEAETNYRAITFILNNIDFLQSEFNINISKEDLIFTKEKIDESFGINNIADYRRYSEYEVVDKLLESITRSKIYWDKYINVLLVIILPSGQMYNFNIKNNGHLNPYVIGDLQWAITQFNRFVKLDSTKVFIEEDSFVIRVEINETLPGLEYAKLVAINIMENKPLK